MTKGRARILLLACTLSVVAFPLASNAVGTVTEAHRIVELLFDLNREAGTTLVLVTHDLELAQLTSRVIRLRGGVVVAEEGMRV